MKKTTLAAIALSVIAFAGCIKNDGSVSTPRAGILVDLLSPNATNTNIVLNGYTIGSNISYGFVPQFYNQITAGPTNIVVTNSAMAPLSNSNVNTDPGKFYSVFIVDSVSKMKAIAVVDSVSSPTTTDSVMVRFFNFAANSPAVSIIAKDSGVTVTGWPARAFETQSTATSNSMFKPLKTGTYEFQILQTGSDVPLKDTSISFEGRHIYTVFLKGFYADTTGAAPFSIGVIKNG